MTLAVRILCSESASLSPCSLQPQLLLAYPPLFNISTPIASQAHGISRPVTQPSRPHGTAMPLFPHIYPIVSSNLILPCHRLNSFITNQWEECIFTAYRRVTHSRGQRELRESGQFLGLSQVFGVVDILGLRSLPAGWSLLFPLAWLLSHLSSTLPDMPFCLVFRGRVSYWPGIPATKYPICLSLLSQHWDYKCSLILPITRGFFLAWILGLKSRSSCLHGKYFTNWLISSVLNFQIPSHPATHIPEHGFFSHSRWFLQTPYLEGLLYSPCGWQICHMLYKSIDFAYILRILSGLIVVLLLWRGTTNKVTLIFKRCLIEGLLTVSEG